MVSKPYLISKTQLYCKNTNHKLIIHKTTKNITRSVDNLTYKIFKIKKF